MDDTVVVGYDRTESADHTLEEAAAAAVRRNASLLVLNAYPPPIPSGAAIPVPATSDWSPTDLVDSANRMVGYGITSVRTRYPTLRVDGLVLAGHAWEVLGEVSRDAALLVVGSHNASGLADAMLGSVTLRVLPESACTVLVVPAGRHTGGGPVVAAVDLDEPCDEVLDFAFAEAGRRQAPLEVVYVWEESRSLRHAGHTEEPGNEVALIENEMHVQLAELLQDAAGRHPGVAATGLIRAGSPARILIETTPVAELIVTGARRYASGQRHRQRIGPVVHTLLHHAECPIAVVPYEPLSGRPGPEAAEN